MTEPKKKLYVVTVEYEAYVLAEEYEDAEDFAQKIVDNEEPFVNCIPVTGDPPNPLRWEPHCCIYHPDMDSYDLTVKEVLP
jgi:hypothetical protein